MNVDGFGEMGDLGCDTQRWRLYTGVRSVGDGAAADSGVYDEDDGAPSSRMTVQIDERVFARTGGRGRWNTGDLDELCGWRRFIGDGEEERRP